MVEEKSTDKEFSITRGKTDKADLGHNPPEEPRVDPNKKKGTLPYNIIWLSIALLIIVTLIGIVYYFFYEYKKIS